jgi:hypothetical protein
MPNRRLTLPAVATLALACVVLGTLAALADGRESSPSRAAAHAPSRTAAPTPSAAARAHARRQAARTAAPTPSAAARAHARRQAARAAAIARTPSAAAPARRRALRAALAAGAPARFPWAVRATPCPAAETAPAAEPVPQEILDAFGVLRRDRAAEDALPAAALTALRGRGLEPFDPAAARLLRSADGGRAWVVPVRDVTDNTILQLRCVLRELPPANPARPTTLKRAPRPARPPGTATAPSATPPAPATAPTKPAGRPHPGLAVVAVDGAPAGAGGRLEDLVRGREEVVLDLCGGANHDMLSVSGIVPDGVAAAFLTSLDGTAIRADVKDNAYAFVVPRAKTPQLRYVVWTGGDGTPHVQPLGAPVFAAHVRCATNPARQRPVVSPDGFGLCGHFARGYLPVPVVPSRRRGPLLLERGPCVIAPTAVPAAPPAPPAVRLAPKTPRPPTPHG